MEKKFKVERIFLFGSTVRGNDGVESDIDLVIVIDRDVSYEDELEAMRIRRGVDLRIEPHLVSLEDFNEGNPFVHEVIKTGVPV